MINTSIRQNCSLMAAAITIFLSGTASAEVLRGDGGPIAFESGYGMENGGSSLSMQWVIVNDENLPVELTQFQIRRILGTRYRGFSIDYSIESQAPVSAVELVFIPFDVWGRSSRPMSATHIQDIPAGTQNFSSEWSILTESDVSNHFVMIGYVAQARLETGEVIKTNLDDVIEEARRLSENFGADNLSLEQ